MDIKTLPGTNIELPSSGYSVRMLLSALFLPEGLMLSQITGLTDLPPYVLQNWVKRGFVPPPVNKKYTQSQFCRVAIINALKDSLQIDVIIKLIAYAGLDYGDNSAVLIDDTALYCYFAESLMRADHEINKLDASIVNALMDFGEPYPGARERLFSILKPMTVLYISLRIKSSAELLLLNLGLFNQEEG